MTDKSPAYPFFALLVALLGVGALFVVVCLFFWEEYQAAGLFAIATVICFGIPAHAEMRR